MRILTAFGIAVICIIVTHLVIAIKTKNKADNTIESHNDDNDNTISKEKEKKFKKKEEKKIVIISSIISLLLIATFTICSFYISLLKSDVEKANNNCEDLKSTIKILREESRIYSNELSFYETSAVICDDHSDYYHKYECKIWDRDCFYIYNTENAESQGYKPCPYCFDNEY